MHLRVAIPALLVAMAAASCISPQYAAPDANQQRLARLAAEIQAAEDVSAIKRLQRTYGYFLDKGLCRVFHR
jgi:hypothetical protein